ncbi:MAG: Rieske 2Fe-2S domain-containing protein [Dehalococcoidia bacterium]|nr:Rieske 2Fe-2S domain-containing protein [Dehalococcoidia bacterium]
MSRRAFIRLSFWGGLGISLLGAAGTAVDFLYPRNVRGFGGPVPVGFAADYVAGAAPVLMREAQAWLVNLDPSEDRLGGAGGGAGLLALWQKCPHLGCAVPWNPTFSYEGDGGGWFRCPCHRSTYTKAGVRVYGPAPRSMDTMLIEVDAAGRVTVQTGAITSGGPDNPSRALPV